MRCCSGCVSESFEWNLALFARSLRSDNNRVAFDFDNFVDNSLNRRSHLLDVPETALDLFVCDHSLLPSGAIANSSYVHGFELHVISLRCNWSISHPRKYATKRLSPAGRFLLKGAIHFLRLWFSFWWNMRIYRMTKCSQRFPRLDCRGTRNLSAQVPYFIEMAVA